MALVVDRQAGRLSVDVDRPSHHPPRIIKHYYRTQNGIRDEDAVRARFDGHRQGLRADRPIARKYLLTVLSKSNATLEAISDGLTDLQDFEARPRPDNLSKVHTLSSDAWGQRGFKASV